MMGGVKPAQEFGLSNNKSATSHKQHQEDNNRGWKK